MEELKNLPKALQKEVLNYAEYLLSRHRLLRQKDREHKWSDITGRGRSTKTTAGDTVVKMRGEERC